MKSREVCKTLGITYSQLWNFVRAEKVKPGKDVSGDLLFDAEAVRQVREALKAKRERLAKQMQPA